MSESTSLSGVSGGSLGVAVFVAAQELPEAARLACIEEFLSGDFLSPLVSGLLFLDIPRLVLPTWIVETHRGDLFEAYVARRWLRLTGKDYFYRKLSEAGGSGSLQPAVFFNATDALSGSLVTLPSKRQTNNASLRLPELSALNKTVLDQLPDLRIAQAVHMSARFPYLSPNPDIRVPAELASEALFGQRQSAGTEKRNVTLASLVDGGYFDNSGLFVTRAVLSADRASGQATQRVVLHLLNDQARTCEAGSDKSGCVLRGELSLEAREDGGRSWLFRPLQAIEAARAEHAVLSVAALSQEMAASGGWSPQLWAVPMVSKRDAGMRVEAASRLTQIGPVPGKNVRSDEVALGWTLAPAHRQVLCEKAASMATRGMSGTPETKNRKLASCTRTTTSTGSVRGDN